MERIESMQNAFFMLKLAFNSFRHIEFRQNENRGKAHTLALF